MSADFRKDLIAQMKNRALIYMEMYDVLSAELGAAQAEALLTRAIFRRGLAAGRALAKHAPDDLAGLQASFLAAREDRKSTRLNSSHKSQSRMPSSA